MNIPVIHSPIHSPLYSPLVGKWGGSQVPLDEQLIAIIGADSGAYYRVSDLDTLFVERTGASATTPASVDGPVGTILDKGARGYHLIAPSDAARGTLRFAGGIYYIENDGTNTRYTNGSNIITSAEWNHYLAMTARRRSAAALNFIRFNSSTNYVRLFEDNTNNRASLVSRNAGGISTLNGVTSSVPQDTWATLDGSSVVGTSTVGVNGGAPSTAANLNTADTTTGQMMLFASTTGNPDTVLGDWAGGFYLNRQPTADERSIINTTLIALYDPSVLEDLGLVLE